ncbi:unnamed protein product [Cylindrotheca closterium]|uniref:RRM domain-containing protein n=1 Tax=Cylindrotheca closterium TaxID=2856 RepID=A0AAD2JLV8_9STRA|nr:unnamed protein product [Cylindrotheca closterium]
MSKVKILLVGSVGENFNVLSKKVNSLNSSKAGPFDVCFCVGPIQVPKDLDSDLPLPVYLQDYQPDKDAAQEKSSNGIVSLGKNLWTFQRTNDSKSFESYDVKLSNHSHPLIVASCSRHIRSDDLSNKDQPQCDILLSSDWPQGMEDVVNVDTEPLSFDLAQVALLHRPRYHVAPSTKFYHASPPYNFPSSTHVCRFLALAPVIQEKPSKTTKFVHAIGLVPLKANPPPTTAPSTLPCPFISTTSPVITNNKASTKFNTSSNSNSNDFRFNLGGNKRGRNGEGGDAEGNAENNLEPPDDPEVNTLFLYGLHRDVTGELQSTESSKVLTAFSKYGVTRVRHPPNSRTTTYCFLEFEDQKKALACILDCSGKYTIDGVELTLKWATQNNRKKQRQEPQYHFVTQAEAPNSTTLYFHPPKKTDDNEALDESFFKDVCTYMQNTLEDALNEGNEEDDRVTAETEPALKVELRPKETFAFLEFSSHAAATMALAAVTNSTDGGLLLEEPTNASKPAANLVGTTLRWAKGEPKQTGREKILEALGLERQHYPADSRTDCWFCLSSPTCETHLIVGVYQQWYATMPKGPLHPGHVLLVPVEHTNRGAWSLETDEWMALVTKLKLHADQTYDMDLFIFERAMDTKGGYHSHIQCVPIPKTCTSKLRATMMAHSKASGFTLRPIESDLGIETMVSADDSYFYAEIVTQSHSHRFLYKHNDDAPRSAVPLQFAREVLASVLKEPKLAHWKSCVLEKEKESEMASELRSSFSPMMS